MCERDWGVISADLAFEEHMSYSCAEDWLLTIDNQNLLSALKGLCDEDINLLGNPNLPDTAKR